MRDHIKILGTLNIILGSLTALAGLGVLLLMGGIATFLSADHQNRDAAPWLGLVGFIVCAILVAISVPAIIGGWGLLKFKPWSRVLMIVISVLSLTHVPVGTAIGVYGLWVLFNDEAIQLLATGGVFPPASRAMPNPAPQAF